MRCVSTAVALAIVLAAAVPVSAHHSFAAQFDGSKPITLVGAITRVEWRSPHIWVYFDVKNPDGSVTNWQCEGGAPNQLTRQGWTRESLAIGGTLEVYGYLARDGTKTCNARTWKLGGRSVLAGAADDGAPAAPRPNR